MYMKGIWPSYFTKVVMIPFQKKQNAVECSDHRTINLISHASKILLKILTNRIEAKAMDLIGRNQFGFRKGCGLRDAIGGMRMICERSLEFGNNVYIWNVEEGIKVGGELIKDVKYADDQGMVANTEAGLRSLMDSLNTTVKHYDMKINIKKTKAMVVSRNGGERVNIAVEGQTVEQVSKFSYLGSLISE